MKDWVKYLLASTVIFTLTTLTGFAQKQAKEVTLTYKISIESSGKTQVGSNLDGASYTVYVKGTDSRCDMVSSLGSESNFYDSKEGKGYILKEYSGQKLMITLTRENWAQKNQYFQAMNFTIDNATQTIAGFTCKKATARTNDGKTVVVYFMPDVTTINKDYNNAFKQLPGIPVQYELESGKLKFTYTLTGISYDPVAETKFDIPKSGFRVMTYDENQQLKKG